MKINTTTMESTMGIPQNAEDRTAIPLLGIYPKKHRAVYNRDTCTLMFITAVITVARLWKQPRRPKADEWIKKMKHI
jgi:hypothetical protein